MKCVFLRYVANQKGYKCYHPPSRKTLIFVDVSFFETIHCFTSSHVSSQGESKIRIGSSGLPYLSHLMYLTWDIFRTMEKQKSMLALIEERGSLYLKKANNFKSMRGRKISSWNSMTLTKVPLLILLVQVMYFLIWIYLLHIAKEFMIVLIIQLLIFSHMNNYPLLIKLFSS